MLTVTAGRTGRGFYGGESIERSVGGNARARVWNRGPVGRLVDAVCSQGGRLIEGSEILSTILAPTGTQLHTAAVRY